MKNCMKKHVNRFLAFCMTWIMVVASVTVTPMTVNAEAAGDEVTTLTVYFENQKGWDRIYTKFGLDDNWAEIAGYEYCMKDYGGIVSLSGDSKWYSFSIEINNSVLTESTVINGLFNGGAWGTGNQSSNFSIKLNEATDKNVWISYVESDEENESDNIVASYETPENWEEESITATNLTDPLDVPIAELDANKSDATKLTLYYYISDENGDCGDYAINVWGGAELTEAGSALTISAWGNQKYRTLLETDEETLPSGKSTGKWVKVGLDVDWDNGMSIDGLQFLTTEGGTDVWNLNIKNMNLTEAYYVPGENGAYGAWYKSAECLDTEKIEIPLPKDDFISKAASHRILQAMRMR